MPSQHRALNSLVDDVTVQVNQAARALESAQEALKTIHHLIDQKNWWHEPHIR